MKSSLSKSGAMVAGLVLAAVSIMFTALPAQAAPPADPADAHVLIFNNASVVDASIGSELERVSNVVTALGGTVTTFDGGDGSALAWQTALAGIHVLVLPEPEAGEFFVTGGTSVVSTAAADEIAAWVNAGGLVVANGSYNGQNYEELLSHVSGLDYSAAFATSDANLVWALQPTVSGAPATVDYVDGTYGLSQYGTWSDELKSIVTPIYLTADGQNLGVGSFAIGSGAFVYIAYDWYPDGGATDAQVEAWVTIQQMAVAGIFGPAAAEPEPEPEPEPALAATGIDSAPWLATGGALLLLGVLLLAARRRSNA